MKEKVPILDHIDEFIRITIPIVMKTQNIDLDDFPVKFTYKFGLERALRGVQSIRSLVKEGMQYHEHGLALISRTLLTDYITFAYMVSFIERPELEAELYRHYYTDQKFVEGHMLLYFNGKVISGPDHEEFKEIVTIPGTLQHKVMDYYSGKELPKDAPSSKEMVKKALHHHPIKPIARTMHGAYDQWFYYSKFEHFGHHSFLFTRNLNVEKMIARLRETLSYAALHVEICCEMLGMMDDFHKMKVLWDKLDEERKVYVMKAPNT